MMTLLAPPGFVIPRYGKTTSPLALRKTRYVHLGRPFISKTVDYGFSQKLRTMASLSSETSDEFKFEKVRPVANFEPDLWGDHFLNCSSESEVILAKKEREHGLLKNELGRELLKTSKEPLEFLKLVHVFERLGVAYHFEDLIEKTLKHIYNNTDKECIQKNKDLDLYHTSLMFRILRQHRYYVTSNVFERFVDKRGNFLESLKDDVISMLSLYEAAHVRGKGEDILEKALDFTNSHLEFITNGQLDHPLATQIVRTLKYPNQRGVIRLESRHYISFYEQDPSHSKRLLRFAKLDFNLLQSSYKEELKEITRWKQRFDFGKKFSFARMRIVELYFFSVGTYCEPQFSNARIIYTKIFIVLSVIDDMYDAFGTIDELEDFTKVVERWDKGCIDQLPIYMREYCEILYDTFMEFENDLAKVGRKNYMDYLKREVIQLNKAYLQEAYWREAKYVPPYEEYFENALKSSAINVVVVMSLLDNDVEESIARKTFDIIFNYCKPQRAACTIGRLVNDIVDYEFDKQRDHVVGAVDCYMKEYGVSKEEACVAIKATIEDAWKDLDEEIYQPTTPIPISLLRRIHNLSRLCGYTYKYVNGYTVLNQRFKDTFTLLFVENLS